MFLVYIRVFDLKKKSERVKTEKQIYLVVLFFSSDFVVILTERLLDVADMNEAFPY